jgi:hypothetical protein
LDFHHFTLPALTGAQELAMHRSVLTLVLGSTLALAAGCSGAQGSSVDEGSVSTTKDPLVAAVPKQEWFALKVASFTPSGEVFSAATTPAKTESTPASPSAPACSAGPAADLAQVTGHVTGDANGLLAGLLGIVGQITATPPAAKSADHAAWGPITSPDAPGLYRLDVDRQTDGAVAFVMSGRPKDKDEWKPLFRGVVRVIDDAHRTGEAQVDFANMHAIDPRTDPVQGGVSLRFGNADGVQAVEMTFGGVAGDKSPPSDAHYVYTRKADGSGGFEFVTHSAATPKQLMRVETSWAPGGAGRSRATMIDAGVPAAKSLVECWAPNAGLVFRAEDGSPAAMGSADCCPK